jgi:hypothetical protein
LSFILRPAQLPERSGMIQAKGQVLWCVMHAKTGLLYYSVSSVCPSSILSSLQDGGATTTSKFTVKGDYLYCTSWTTEDTFRIVPGFLKGSSCAGLYTPPVLCCEAYWAMNLGGTAYMDKHTGSGRDMGGRP